MKTTRHSKFRKHKFQDRKRLTHLTTIKVGVEGLKEWFVIFDVDKNLLETGAKYWYLINYGVRMNSTNKNKILRAFLKHTLDEIVEKGKELS